MRGTQEQENLMIYTKHLPLDGAARFGLIETFHNCAIDMTDEQIEFVKQIRYPAHTWKLIESYKNREITADEFIDLADFQMRLERWKGVA